MTPRDDRRGLAPGDTVRSPFGRGIVRDVRNNGGVLVEIQGRAVLMDASTLTPADAGELPVRGAKTRRRVDHRQADSVSQPAGVRADRAAAASAPPVREIDLHGLTVDEALPRIDAALDGAMRDDVAELRIIHGRSGGRLRAALHRRLGAIPSVRAFGIDPRNEGVTIVRL
jgi:dsDNA-specific endonuclease/ATPase MutS2